MKTNRIHTYLIFIPFLSFDSFALVAVFARERMAVCKYEYINVLFYMEMCDCE